jgi:hypothetical protein
MFDIWTVNGDARPIERVGSEHDPHSALVIAARILKRCGSPALDARNLNVEGCWPYVPSLIVFDPTATIPLRIVVVGSMLTEQDGTMAETSVGVIPTEV